MWKPQIQFLILCVLPLVILTLGASALLLAGHHAAAWVVSWGGTIGWLLIVLVYIVLVDARGRWPKARGWERLRRVLTFTR